MKISALELSDRKLLSVSGNDRQEFLQGLITNDISIVDKDNSIFSAFLMPNGRFLADFFIYEYNDQYIIDIHDRFYESFLKKLKLYKLRSAVEILVLSGKVLLSQDEGLIKENFALLDEIPDQVQDNGSGVFAVNPGKAVVSKGKIISIDNRNNLLGARVVILDEDLLRDFKIEGDSLIKYHQLRIEHKVIDGAYDLTIEKSIILEFGYHNISAINFDKGCYLGQELMTRTYRTGVIRKQIFKIKIEDMDEMISQNTQILTTENQKIGKFCFGYKKDKQIFGLALLTIEDVKSIQNQEILLTFKNEDHQVRTKVVIS